MKKYFKSAIVLIILFIEVSIEGQVFTEINNSSISTANIEDFWTGAAWIDLDNDNDLDLVMANRKPGREMRTNKVYINKGSHFEALKNSPLVDDLGYWFSVTSGDYNNDGFIDVYIAGYPGALYKGMGNGKFIKVDSGIIAKPTSSGICAGFGDFNNDGLLDLIVTRPEWLESAPWTGPPTSPLLLINKGAPDFDFEKIETTDLSIPEKDTYMHPTLFDLDDDNDLDIFIGMGSGRSKVDLMYENMYTDNNKIDFKRWNDIEIAKALVEGNQWSFNDIDNDGDWDVHITNWATVSDGIHTPSPNFLFRNENGNFIKENNGPITTDSDMTTTSLWGDFDNDADLDAIMVSDSTYVLRYYENNGHGIFKSKNVGDLNSIDKHQSGGSVGDYDNDGDLDLFIPGPGKHSSLLNNELDNGNNWIKLKLIGDQSNHSAIGAKINLTIKIDGKKVTQRRVISSTDVFFGQNSIIQHFGLKKAFKIESVSILWPTGKTESFSNLKINSLNELKEGTGKTNIKIKSN